jgi:hypothetical protein
MSYHTRVSGQFAIDPPIPYERLYGTEWVPPVLDGPSPSADVYIACAIEPIKSEQDPWVILGFTGHGATVLPRWESDYDATNLLAEVQRLVDAFPDHTFTGLFDCHGEERGDIWRIEIHDGQAVEVRPQLVWPDGTVEVFR